MMYLRFKKRKKITNEKLADVAETPFEDLVEPGKTTAAKNSKMEEEKKLVIDETHISEATRIVVMKTMEVLKPLLDKLGEAVAQQKQETEASKEPNLADHLTKLKDAATERLAIQEQKVAARIGKVQARIAKVR